MNRRMIFIFLGALCALFSLLLLYSFLRKQSAASFVDLPPPSFEVIQYIDRHTFSHPDELEKWLDLTCLISNHFQTHYPHYHIKIIVDEESYRDLKAKIENINDSRIQVISAQDSTKPFNPYLYFSSQDYVALISPDFLCDLYHSSPSEKIFFEAILGVSLKKNQIYLFSRFDRRRFRVEPKFILFLGAHFNTQFSEKLQIQWVTNHQEYLSLLNQRNLFLSDPENPGYIQSSLSRIQWLKENSSDSIFESGLYSQGLGEQFWQDRVWNCNSRYIIAPLNWPIFQSDTPCQPIITAKELSILFPGHLDSLIQCAIAYNDYLYARKMNIPSALRFLLTSQENFHRLSQTDQKKFIIVYGSEFAPEIFA